jgi:hypothetical protein
VTFRPEFHPGVFGLVDNFSVIAKIEHGASE